jgi:hypothetical protein
VSRRRLVTLGLIAATVALGLASRRLLPAWVGDALYAVMVYWLVVFLRPALASLKAGLLTWALCAGVEVSQLWHPAWLDAVRATLLGRLVLGTTFVWSDLAYYALGALTAALSERGRY